MNALGNQLKSYPMPWRRSMSFINDIQANPSPLFMELVIRRGGDVTNANAVHSFECSSMTYNKLILNI
jgi:hypothetical protein